MHNENAGVCVGVSADVFVCACLGLQSGVYVYEYVCLFILV